MASRTFLPVCISHLRLSSRLAGVVPATACQRFPGASSVSTFSQASLLQLHSHKGRPGQPFSTSGCIKLPSNYHPRVGQTSLLCTPHTELCCSPRRSLTKKAKKDKAAKGGKKKVELNAEELDGVLDVERLRADMMAVVTDLSHQMLHQISVRTNIGAYDNLPVKTDNGVVPLMQLGQVVQKSPSLILINMVSAPQCIQAAKEAIAQSGLNVNPQQEGTTLFIQVPKVTREYREGLVKKAKAIHDKSKVHLRDIHNKYVKKVKAAKDHHAEDVIRSAQNMVLDEMHNYNHQLDALLTKKQEELLSTK